MSIALQNYRYSCHHVCAMMGHIFSDMCGIMDPNFLTKMAHPRPKLGLVTPPPTPFPEKKTEAATQDRLERAYHWSNVQGQKLKGSETLLYRQIS